MIATLGESGWSRAEHDRRLDALCRSEGFRDDFLDNVKLFGLCVFGFVVMWAVGSLVCR